MTTRKATLRETVIASPDAAQLFVTDQAAPADLLVVPEIGAPGESAVAVELTFERFTIATGVVDNTAGTASCALIVVSPAHDGTANKTKVDASAGITLTTDRPAIIGGLFPGDSIGIRATAYAAGGGDGGRFYARFMRDSGGN